MLDYKVVNKICLVKSKMMYPQFRRQELRGKEETRKYQSYKYDYLNTKLYKVQDSPRKEIYAHFSHYILKVC